MTSEWTDLLRQSVEKGEEVLNLCALGIEDGPAPGGVLDGRLLVQQEVRTLSMAQLGSEHEGSEASPSSWSSFVERPPSFVSRIFTHSV